MVNIKDLAIAKLYNATDKPSTTTCCKAANCIEAALVCLVIREKLFADWIVTNTTSSFPLIVERVYELICRINRRLATVSSYTYFRGLPEPEIHAILNNYYDYLMYVLTRRR